MAKQYGIWCEVRGGVTGARAAWAKSGEAIERFSTEEAAIAEAERLEHQANGNPYRRASFRYSARELEFAK